MFFFSGNHFIKATFVYSFRVSSTLIKCYLNSILGISTHHLQSLKLKKKITLEFSDMNHANHLILQDLFKFFAFSRHPVHP